MAKIVFSSIGITSIKGRAAGTLFTSNGSGASFGNFKQKTNSNSSAKSLVTSKFKSLQSQWRQLTEEERDSWRYADVTGVKGINLFLQRNGRLSPYTNQFIRSYPNPHPITNIEHLSFEAGYAQQYPQGFIMSTSTLIAEYNNPRMQIVITASPPVSAGNSSPPGNMYAISKVQITGTQINYNFQNDYYLRFGYPPVGAKVFIALQIMVLQTGQVMPPFISSTIIIQV